MSNQHPGEQKQVHMSVEIREFTVFAASGTGKDAGKAEYSQISVLREIIQIILQNKHYSSSVHTEFHQRIQICITPTILEQ